MADFAAAYHAQQNTNNGALVTATPALIGIDSRYTTPMLTVWRRLHVEVDSMGAVTGNSVSGNITGINVPACTAPSITLQPVSQTFCLGYTASFTVTASGTSLSYQWRKGGANLVNGSTISGVTSNTLTISAVATNNVGSYDVVIANTCGSVTSSVATLTTTLVPSILTQPASLAKCQGQAASFSVIASGAQGYQWRKNSVNISSATSTTLTLSAVSTNSAGSYDVVVTNNYGSVTSSSATLTVFTAAPSITLQPTNQTVCVGQTANFTVGASNALGYQWRKNASSISGATNAILTLTNVTASAAAYYNVVVSNSCSSLLSSTATLTVNALPTVYSVTGGGAYCSGGAGVAVGLSGSQTGVNYHLMLNGFDTGLSVAGTGSTISFGLQTGAGVYTVLATMTNTSCYVSMNSSATVVVNAIPSAPTASNNGPIYAGQTLTLSASTASNATYSWTGPNGFTSTAQNPSISNATTVASGIYSVTVTIASCASAAGTTTGAVSAVIITGQPQGQTVMVGSNVMFGVTASGITPLSYRWRKNGSELTETSASTSTLTLTNVTTLDAGIYTVTVSNTYGSVASYCAALRVFSPSGVVAWGYNNDGETTIPSGLTNAVAIDAGGYHNLALKRDGTVSAWGADWCGETDVPAGLTNVMAVAGGMINSLALKSDGTVVAWGDGVYGETNVPVGLTNVVAIAASAGWHGLALKSDGTVVAWGHNGYGQTNVPSGLTNVVAVDGGYYHSLALKSDGTVVAWGGDSYGQTNVPAGLTNVVAVAAGAYHSMALKSDGTVVAWGLNAGGTSVPTGLTNVVAIAAGANDGMALKANGTVVAWGWNGYGETDVPAGLTNVVAVAAGDVHGLALGNVPPSITTQPTNQSVCADQGVSFTAAASGSPTPTVQWQVSTNSVTFTNMSGATSTTLTFTASVSDNDNQYRVVFSNAYGNAISTAATLTVATAPTITVQPTNLAVLAGESASFTAAASGSPTPTVQWQVSTGGGTTFSDISGATSDILTILVGASDDGNQYRAVFANSCGSVTGSSAVLTINQPPVITQLPTDQSVYVGQTATFSVTASGSGLTYQWKHNGVDITGGTNATLSISNVQSSDAGGYSIIVANNAGSASADVQLLVIQVFTPSNNRIRFTLSGASSNGAYDIYLRPSLSSGINYRIFYCGSLGQTNFSCPIPSASMAFFRAGSAKDTDGDGLTDGYEALVSYSDYNLTKLDSDSDGLPDGWEAEWGLDPTSSVGTNGASGDPDGDGTTNSLEYANGTDPWLTSSNPRPVVTVSMVNGMFQITRTGSTNSSLTVNYTVGGTATYGVDYTLSPSPSGNYPFPISIAAGATSANLSMNSASGNTTGNVMVALVPFALSDAAPTNWTYVVNPYRDRASLALGAPSITNQPQSQTVMVGSNVMFSVAAVGATPLSYQWWKNGSELTVTSATTSALSLTNVTPWDAGIYTVTVSNTYGSVVSYCVALRVFSPSGVVAWGDNGYGQTNVPSSLTNTVEVGGGMFYGLALKADRTVVGWGNNSYGQTNIPSGATNVVAIGVGYWHNLVLKGDGTMVAWGLNGYGEASVPSYLTNNVVTIAAGGFHNLALKADRTVVAWGDDNYGETDVPIDLTNVVGIAGGWIHSLALKADGTVVAWGDNGYGQTNVPSGLTNVVAISGGYFHSLALKSDGTVVAWGNNNWGQTNVPSGLTNVVAISAGEIHNLAIKADGTAVAWGWNGYGQTTVPLSLVNLVGVAGGKQHSLALENLLAGPVAWWKLDEGTGVKATDAAGNGNDGTLINAPTWVTGIISNALSFDGSSDQYVEAEPTGTVDGTFTVAAWVLPLDSTATMSVFSTRMGSDASFDFKLASGNQIHADIGNGSSWLTTSADASFQYTTGMWYHIAYVVTPTNYTIYANGAVVGSGSYDVAVPLLYDANRTITIGAEADWSELFNGSIDDVRVYGRALSASEVAALHNTDSIGDGIPNWWRQQYFGSGSTTNSNSCASCDPDGDGYANLQEYQAGTDPFHSPLPTLSPDGGAYLTAQSVTVSYATTGVTIHYTTNGLVPTESDTVIASGGTITVSGPTTLLRARAFKTGMTTSDTKSGLYQIGARVAAGWDGSFALTTNGTLWAWGRNDYGQLDDGTTANRSFPAVVGISNVRAATDGERHTVAVDTNGTVWMWGNNGNGQLGDGTTTDNHVPGRVTGVSNVVAVAAGQNYTVALRSDGTVWTWGNNGNGQLGDGTTTESHVPGWVTGVSNVVAVAAGQNYTVALRSDGTVWTWGNNGNGQLGDGTTTESHVPERVAGVSNVVAIAAEGNHTVALCSDKMVWTWGNNGNGQLGDGTTTDSHVPKRVTGVSNVMAITAGEYHTLAVTATGQVYAWGYNGNGQLGLGDNDDRAEPQLVSSLSSVLAVSAGNHSLAIESDGTIWSWGANSYGQLGRCTTQNENTPGKVGLSVKSVAPTLAIVSGTTNICYGNSATIQAELTGTGPWMMVWSDGVVQTDVATSPLTRNVSPDSTTTYTVTAVSDSTCTAGISSGSAIVTVYRAPSITLNPSNQVACASSASFTAAASGSPTPTVQWQVSTDGGGSFGDISGATSETLIFSVTASDRGNAYRAVFSNVCGTATSDSATLGGGTATAMPSSVTCGISSATIMLSGDTTGATIQWQLSLDYNEWMDIVGGTNAVLNTGALTVETYYRAITSSSGCLATSGVAYVSIIALNGGSATASPSAVTCGDSATITLSGYTTGATIQWQSSPDESVWTDVTGATGETMDTGAITVKTYYRTAVGVLGCLTYSGDTSVSIDGLNGGTATATPSSVACGDSATITLSGYTTGATIQWQSSPDGNVWTDVTGATGETMDTGALTVGTYYRAVVSYSGCSANSSQVFVSVDGLNGGTAVVVSSSVITCGVNSATIMLSNYTAGVTIQWQSSVDLSVWTDIAGATGETMNTGAITVETYYRAVVSRSGCASAYSDYATVIIGLSGGTAVATPPSFYCSCDGVVMVTLTNYTTNAAIQWQSSVDGIDYTDIVGEANAVLKTMVTATTWFRAKLTSTNCPSVAYSSEVEVLVNVDSGTVSIVPPLILTQPTNQTVCPGYVASFTVTALNCARSYQWRVGDKDLTNVVGSISGTTNATLTLSNVTMTSTGNYTVVVGNDYGSVTSSVATLNVFSTSPAITLQPVTQTNYLCQTARFTVAASGGSLSYHWRKNGVNLSNGPTVNGSTNSGVATATLEISNVTTADTVTATSGFDCVISSACASPSVTSSRVGLKVLDSSPYTSIHFFYSEAEIGGHSCCRARWNLYITPENGTEFFAGVVDLNNLPDGGDRSSITVDLSPYTSSASYFDLRFEPQYLDPHTGIGGMEILDTCGSRYGDIIVISSDTYHLVLP